MTARVLVVDDVPANVKLLEARLSAEYFDVVTAERRRGSAGDLRARRVRPGAARRDDARHGRLRSVPPAQVQSADPSHPGGDGDGARSAVRPGARPRGWRRRFPHQAGIGRSAHRARAFAGAAQDDDRRVAYARRHLARYRHRRTRSAMRSPKPAATAPSSSSTTGRRPRARSPQCLRGSISVDIEADPNEALFHAAEGNYDLMIVSLRLANFDGLRLCSQIRSLERTRNVPILAIAEAENNTRLVRGLEIGVNDYLIAADRQERAAGAGAHADPQEALHRAAARQRADVDRDGDHRCAHRPATTAATWKAMSGRWWSRRQRAASR